MTPEQVELIQNSFEKIKPIEAVAAKLFYERLFSIAPQVRHMFKADLTSQGMMLMQSLGAAVALLDNPERLILLLEGLGQRHKGYGVTEEHFAPVGQALLWTLEQGLGADFSGPTREAWTELFDTVQCFMLKGLQARA